MARLLTIKEMPYKIDSFRNIDILSLLHVQQAQYLIPQYKIHVKNPW